MQTKEKLIEKLKELKDELINIDNELFEMYGHEPKSPGAVLGETTDSIGLLISKLENEGMYTDLKVNDRISIASNHSGYDFHRVFFVRQSFESITILDYVPDQEIEIPKSYIVEITKH